MKLVKESVQSLLKRKTVIFQIEHGKQSTPTNASLLKNIAGHFKIPEDCISLEHVYTNYGMGMSEVIAYVYETKEALLALKYKKKVKKAKEGAPAQASEEKKA